MKVLRFAIADKIVSIKSRWNLNPRRARDFFSPGNKVFLYHGKQKNDIEIDVDVVEKLPLMPKSKKLFAVHQVVCGKQEENWGLFTDGEKYFYRSAERNCRQISVINKNFTKAKVYLFGEERGETWDICGVTHNFLEILLISHLAKRSEGIFIHCAAIAQDKNSLNLFVGQSGHGKSTMSRLWHRYAKSMVINDDRVAVRKINNRYVAYRIPWHGEFSRWNKRYPQSVPIKNIFFIEHAKANKAVELSLEESFKFLFPNIFATFWDAQPLGKTLVFTQGLLKSVKCRRLPFVKNKTIISFVHAI